MALSLLIHKLVANVINTNIPRDCKTCATACYTKDLHDTVGPYCSKLSRHCWRWKYMTTKFLISYLDACMSDLVRPKFRDQFAKLIREIMLIEQSS